MAGRCDGGGRTLGAIDANPPACMHVSDSALPQIKHSGISRRGTVLNRPYPLEVD